MALQTTEGGYQRACSSPPESSSRLGVYVLFTEVPSTLSALRTAAQLCDGLDGNIRLLLPETVPFPLPLEEPRRDLRLLGRRFRTLVDASGAVAHNRSVDTTIEILVCRDAGEAFLRRLEPGSVVVIGKRSRWWPCREDRWARLLRAAGHRVVRTSAPLPLMKGTARG